MPHIIKPTVDDPECIDPERMPADMPDPDYPLIPRWGHAYRAAADFRQCPNVCPRKACRAAKSCLAWPPPDDGKNPWIDPPCVSPRWSDEVCELAKGFHRHAARTILRRMSWARRRRDGIGDEPFD